MNIFTKTDYKKILIQLVEEKKRKLGSSFTLKKMAKFCHLQTTYLSKILNQSGNFSSDQLYQISKYLQLEDDESEYLLLLLEWERSQFNERKLKLELKIRSLREVHLKTKNFIPNIDQDEPKKLNQYYLNPWCQVVHIFLTIPSFKNNPQKMLEYLPIHRSLLKKILTILKDEGIIDFNSTMKIKLLKKSLHLSSDHPLYSIYRQQMKLLTLQKIDHCDEKDRYSFNVLFSSDETTNEWFRLRFLQLVEELQKTVASKKPTTVYQMNFDLFSWN